MCDIAAEALKKIPREEREKMWQLFRDMQVGDIKMTHFLNQELMQYSLGKTQKLLEYVSAHYYSNYYSQTECHRDHNLCLIATNNSLAETEQWKVRVGKKFNKQLNIAIFSSDTEANYNRVDALIAALSTAQPKNLPHIIIMCCHPVRISQDIPKLLEYAKSNIRLDGIRFVTNFVFDEVDKTQNLNLVIKLVNKFQIYKYIQDIIWITATPLKEFWKKLRKAGLIRLTNIDNHLADIPNRINLNQDYCKITDHKHINLSNRPTNPVEYIEYILKHTSHINLNNRNVIFAPGKCGRKSHEKISKIFNQTGFIVLMHNGKHKEFRFPNGEVISIKDYKKENNIKGELRDSLRRLGTEFPKTSIVITGCKTVERGITMNTDGFNFTHMIIADYHGKKLNTLLQLMGRSAGHNRYVKQMNVICSETIWAQAREFNENMKLLKSTSPDVYIMEDFIDFTRKKDSYPPIIIKFKYQKLARQFYKDKIKPVFKGKRSNGPRFRKKNEDGKYTASIRGVKKIYTRDEVNSNIGWGLSEKSLWRFTPCYEDVNDDNSLQFWYTIYPGANMKTHPLYKYHNKLINK